MITDRLRRIEARRQSNRGRIIGLLPLWQTALRMTRLPTEAAQGYDMNLRRTLFRVWCGCTFLWWLIPLFGGDGNRILLKFQMGGWRGAYLHLALTVLIAVGIPVAALLVGRAVLWRKGRFHEKLN